MLALPLLLLPLQVRECPVGTYRGYYMRVTDKAASFCLPCPLGWTTAGTGAMSMAQCNRE